MVANTKNLYVIMAGVVATKHKNSKYKKQNCIHIHLPRISFPQTGFINEKNLIIMVIKHY